ncbi:Thioredoxin-like [bacterium A37T11]|nr:Thioredoxin-like [bacterium A37T11]
MKTKIISAGLAIFNLFFFLGLFGMSFPVCRNVVSIKGFVSNRLKCDSLRVSWTIDGIENEALSTVKVVMVPIMEGEFEVELPSVTTPIAVKFNYRLDGHEAGFFPGGYYLEPGDNVFIDDRRRDDEHPFRILFRGKNSAKLECQRWIMEHSASLGLRFPDARLLTPEKVRSLDSLCLTQLKYIEQIRGCLSRSAYQYLKVMALTNCEVLKYLGLVTYRIKCNFPFTNKSFQNEIKRLSILKDLDHETCAEFYTFAFYKYKYEASISQDRFVTSVGYYDCFMQNYTGPVREVLLTKFLLTYKFPEAGNYINKALEIITTPIYRHCLHSLKKITNGKKAMEISLLDTFSMYHAVNGFRDSVVVLDFWFTGCGGCLQIKPYLDTLKEMFKSKPVKFVSVSSDNKFSVWKKSIIDGHYTSKGCLNLYTNGLGHDSPIIKYYNVNSYPTLVVIDKNGCIAPSPVDPRFDNYKSIRTILNELTR